jgi:hypothetical protein
MGYGLAGWAISLILRLLMPVLLPEVHKPATWTVGKAILKNLHEIFWIGIGIFLYSSLLIRNTPFSWKALYYFQLYAFTIAPIPTILIVWLQQRRLERLDNSICACPKKIKYLISICLMPQKIKNQ